MISLSCFPWRHVWIVSLLSSLLCLCTLAMLVYITDSDDATGVQTDIQANAAATVVTAYYLFKSKHTHKRYTEWIRNFLSNIPCQLVVFTDRLMLPLVKSLRRTHLRKTRFYEKNFTDFKMSKKGDFWTRQRRLDPERELHTENLYIIWNEKITLVMEAIATNVFQSDYFVWCDIGSFRSLKQIRELKKFPNSDKLSQLDKRKLYFLQTDVFNKTDFAIGDDDLPAHDFERENRVGGTVIVGHKDAWRAWHGVYYEVLERMARAGRFVGKDQNVMASVAVMYPDMIELIKAAPFFGGEGNPWFYMHYYFS